LNNLSKILIGGSAAAALTLTLMPSSIAVPKMVEEPNTSVTLTLLHNNDGESSLTPRKLSTPSGDLTIGGVAAFAAVMDREIADARGEKNAVLTVYAGDSFLAGSALACSEPTNAASTKPVYDAVAQAEMDYDVHVLGNHEFDFTTSFLGRFIGAFDAASENENHVFISGNMDFSNNTDLAKFTVTPNKILDSYAIHTDPVTGHVFGVVSAIFPQLATISSPGTAQITSRDITDTAKVIQYQIDRLEARGINKIILVSHLQDMNNDIELISKLEGVDVAVAGGGDEILANKYIAKADQLLPGDEWKARYPISARNAVGGTKGWVPLVTAKGQYSYLGRLDVTFDRNGNLTGWDNKDSYPRRVVVKDSVSDALGITDAVTPKAALVSSVEAPVADCVSAEEETILATTTIDLDISKNAVRGAETASGNLVADAYLHAYATKAADAGLSTSAKVIAATNGGGLRQNNGDAMPVAGSNNITMADVRGFLPFGNNQVALVDMTPADIKAMFERSAASVGGGAFLQIAGAKVVYDTTKDAQVIDPDGKITTAGSRVTTLTLDDGTKIVDAGRLVSGAPKITLVTNGFTARGGDDYVMLSKYGQVQLGADYADTLVEFLGTFPKSGSYPQVPAKYGSTEGRTTIIK
jgi:5'-nucleotidase